MNIVTLDLEGVLIPEIWIAFAEASGIPELRRTTRDEPDYDKLMRYRLDILSSRGIKLADIQDVIATLEPLDGAKEFIELGPGAVLQGLVKKIDRTMTVSGRQ